MGAIKKLFSCGKKAKDPMLAIAEGGYEESGMNGNDASVDMQGNNPVTPRSPSSGKGPDGVRTHKNGEVVYEHDLGRIPEEGSLVSKSASRIKYTRAQTVPPPAREAAFHGPPRFDWIDIETAAATKIQASTRRFIVMNDMEARGVRTSAIRNRRRRRKAQQRNDPHGNKAVSSEDTPSFLACCGAGLAFGDATEEDDAAFRQFQRQQYEERIKQQVDHEAALRTRYLRSHGGGHLVEEIEVIE